MKTYSSIIRSLNFRFFSFHCIIVVHKSTVNLASDLLACLLSSVMISPICKVFGSNTKAVGSLTVLWPIVIRIHWCLCLFRLTLQNPLTRLLLRRLSFLVVLQEKFFALAGFSLILSLRCRRHACLLFSFLCFEHRLDLFFTSFFLDNPIISTIIIITAATHYVFKKSSEVIVIRLFFKHNIATVLQVLRKFFRLSLRELFNCCLDFTLLNSVILVIFVLSSKSLPWESTFK
jgi:hypothetical protein